MLIRRIARPLLASAFVVDGVDTLRHPEPRAKAAAALVNQGERISPQLAEKLPADPAQLVRINAAAQVGAGVLLALGRAPRLASLVLAATVIPSTVTEQNFWAESDPDRRAAKQTAFLKDLSLLGGLMIAAADTEGKPSLGWRGRRAARRAAAALPFGDPGSDDLRDRLQQQAIRGRDLTLAAAERGAGLIETHGPALVDAARRHGGELADRAQHRGVEIAGIARNRGGELAETAQHRGSELAEVARDRSSELAELARDRGGRWADTARHHAADWTDTAQQRGAELADTTRDRAGDLVGTARDRAVELAETARDRASDLAETARDRAAERPDIGRGGRRGRRARRRAAARAQQWPEVARQRAGELADRAREQAVDLAETAKARGPELADTARTRTAEWSDSAGKSARRARRRGAELTDQVRDTLS